METRELVELGVLPLDIQREDMGWRVQWGPEPEPAQEGLPLLPLRAEPMEVDGAKQVQEDGATVEDDAVVEKANSLVS